MKNRFGAERAVPVRTREEVEAMPTKALLARLERLHRCEESPSDSDLSPLEVPDDVGILFKNQPAWAIAYQEVKEVLATREHVPGGDDRRRARAGRAKRNRDKEKRRRR